MTQDVIDTDEEESAELTAEQKRIRRRNLAQAAIVLATQHRWDESISVNQEILSMFPDDPEANNRVGNAMTELGRVAEAIEAYEATLKAQPTNAIASRNAPATPDRRVRRHRSKVLAKVAVILFH